MSKKTISVNFGWLSLLGVLFVGLKLTGHIAWSWWWVLLPFYGPFLVFVATVLVLALVVALVKGQK